jgi:hypothetical protein
MNSTDQTLLNEYVQLMCTANLRETDFNADVLSALLSDDSPLFLALQALHAFNAAVASAPPVHNRDELLQQVLYETRAKWEEAPSQEAFEELISKRASVDAGLYWELFVLCCTGNDIVPLLTPTLCLALYALGSADALTSVISSFEKVDKNKKNWSMAKRQTALLNLCNKAAMHAMRANTPSVSPTSDAPNVVTSENPAAPNSSRSPTQGSAVVSWAGAAKSLPATNGLHGKRYV